MNNLTGIWEGEYSVNIGTEEDPRIEYHTFRLELSENDDQITGTGKDLTLSNEPSTISGFRDGEIISFIKKYKRLVFVELDDYFTDDASEHPDIHYLGTYNIDEHCYQGTWEMKSDVERDSLQDTYIERLDVGNWYMRKI